MIPISLEEYIAYNPASRRKAIKLVYDQGFRKPKNEQELMIMLSEVIKERNPKALMELAAIHPDAQLFKFVASQKDEDSSSCDGDPNCDCECKSGMVDWGVNPKRGRSERKSGGCGCSGVDGYGYSNANGDQPQKEVIVKEKSNDNVLPILAITGLMIFAIAKIAK